MNQYHKIKGLCLIVLGIIAFMLPLNTKMQGNTAYKETYGGDAYTGIQNASAQVAVNTYYLGCMMDEIFTKTMIFTGLVFTCAGSLVLYKEKMNHPGIQTLEETAELIPIPEIIEK